MDTLGRPAEEPTTTLRRLTAIPMIVQFLDAPGSAHSPQEVASANTPDIGTRYLGAGLRQASSPRGSPKDLLVGAGETRFGLGAPPWRAASDMGSKASLDHGLDSSILGSDTSPAARELRSLDASLGSNASDLLFSPNAQHPSGPTRPPLTVGERETARVRQQAPIDQMRTSLQTRLAIMRRNRSGACRQADATTQDRPPPAISPARAEQRPEAAHAATLREVQDRSVGSNTPLSDGQ